MAQFDDREKAHEAKFARDGELRFKAEARRNKLLGLWAAEHMGLSEEHAKTYAAEAANTVVFVFMVIVLLLRPAGLFGRAR